VSGPVFRYAAQSLRDRILDRRERYAKALDLGPKPAHADGYRRGVALYDELLSVIDRHVAASQHKAEAA
jgi:hypothetical protein